MYVHKYQIHNVLDVYRKQLSQGSIAEYRGSQPSGARSGSAALPGPPHQMIIDRVSAQIVDRIVQEGPRNRFADTLIQEYTSGTVSRAPRYEAQFTYTAIDENDRKTTNTMPIEKISPLLSRMAQAAPDSLGGSDG
jgi:hypothetical protein